MPTDRALEEIWRDTEPGAAARSLHVYVSSLRKALGSAAGAIQTRPGGYALAVADEDLDVTRFERLAAEGRQASRGRGGDSGGFDPSRRARPVARSALADVRYEEFALIAVDQPRGACG